MILLSNPFIVLSLLVLYPACAGVAITLLVASMLLCFAFGLCCCFDPAEKPLILDRIARELEDRDSAAYFDDADESQGVFGDNAAGLDELTVQVHAPDEEKL